MHATYIDLNFSVPVTGGYDTPAAGAWPTNTGNMTGSSHVDR